jgi:hypothetical protein
MWYMILVLAIWSGSCAAMDHQTVVTVDRDTERINRCRAWEAAMMYHDQRCRQQLSADAKKLHAACADYLVKFTTEPNEVILAEGPSVIVHTFKNSLVWVPFLNSEREAKVLKPMGTLAQLVLCSILGSKDYSVVCAVDAENNVHKWTLKSTFSEGAYRYHESHIKYAQRIPDAIKAVRLMHEHAAVVFTEKGASLAVDSGDKHSIIPIPHSREMTRIKANIKYDLYKCINADKSSTIYRVEGNNLGLIQNAQALEKKFESQCTVQ